MKLMVGRSVLRNDRVDQVAHEMGFADAPRAGDGVFFFGAEQEFEEAVGCFLLALVEGTSGH